MTPEASDIYAELQRAARSGGVTHYSSVAPLLGVSIGDPAGRLRVAELLKEISTAEHAAGRPLLSAVVVMKGKKLPGAGFFGLAQRVGLYDGADPRAFWRREVQRVWDYWRER
ncbi:MAG: hypothetical protein EXR54_10030 [Dehalococcoidia bacterium]|nr:hypothetical protein [Dehalococcoidia bacterium]MSQ17870.1 hypothetical protein [Dehalococcoidia bacterium]